VVRDPETRIETLVAVAESARAAGQSVMGFASSGLPGPSGNRETFAWIAEPGRDGALDDVDAAARAVEE
jgi:23S rRNA (cytidine1920-2'-O)/16S rRNA (cytidine1409-2'-O)-methyltransferase